MKDRALSIADSQQTDLQKRNHLREYLQHVILRELFDLGVLERLVFHGGTALRLLHGLERFSEDLDFHTEQSSDDFTLDECLAPMKTQLEHQGYQVEYTSPSTGAVESSFIKFRELLYAAGVSRHENENLSIEFEVDTNPPDGFDVDTSMVNHFFPYVVHHHDKPSFIAGKLHAVFQREWTKGRDYYDLMFYLSRWEDVDPNLIYLNNALDQTNYEGATFTKSNWREETAKRVEEVDWKEVHSDLEPFAMRRSDLDAFRREFLLSRLRDE